MDDETVAYGMLIVAVGVAVGVAFILLVWG